jgi:CDP-paratose 2-epimerase
MKKKTILVTGSIGLIGSEVVGFFASQGYDVDGIDNNQREVFFGLAGDTRWNQKRLQKKYSTFCHHELDIRDRSGVLAIFQQLRPRAIVHAAAQPSHDLASAIPFDDFETNALGTLNLLEATRRFCSDSPFIYLSTNKVYGDAPNQLKHVELETR